MHSELKKLLGEQYPEFHLFARSRDGEASITIYDSGEVTNTIIHTGAKRDTAFALRSFLYTLLGLAYSLLPETPSIPIPKKKKA